MGSTANLIQVLQSLSEWGIVTIILVFVAALIGKYLFQAVTSQISKKLAAQAGAMQKLDILHSSNIDDNGKPIPRSELLRGILSIKERLLSVEKRLDFVEERCIPEKCPFHAEMLKNTETTRDLQVEQTKRIESFVEEGRQARNETARRMEQIFGDYQKVSDALLGFVGKIIERTGNPKS